MSKKPTTGWAGILGCFAVALGASIGGPALADTFAIKCGDRIFTIDSQANTVALQWNSAERSVPAVITPTTIDFSVQYTNFYETWHIDRVTAMMHEHLEIPRGTSDHDYACTLIKGF
jgi:hypothetical protein